MAWNRKKSVCQRGTEKAEGGMFHKAPSIVWEIRFQNAPEGSIHLAGSKVDKQKWVGRRVYHISHHSVIGSSCIVRLKAAIMEKSIIVEEHRQYKERAGGLVHETFSRSVFQKVFQKV